MAYSWTDSVSKVITVAIEYMLSEGVEVMCLKQWTWDLSLLV